MSFKSALSARTPLLGTFLKTPSPMVCEVLGRTDLDVICVDAEHAPFDRGDIDACVLALRAVGKPSLVRVPKLAAEHVLNALDCGATGVLAPHVATPAEATAFVDMATFGRGRGFAGSTRAAGYMARGMAEHLNASNAERVLIAQIEDAEALTDLSMLMATPGIDAWFIGRADLTVALGAASMDAPEVVDAVQTICQTGQTLGTAVGMFVANLDEVPRWRAAGASLFLLSSDHGMMLAGAKALSQQVRAGF